MSTTSPKLLVPLGVLVVGVAGSMRASWQQIGAAVVVVVLFCVVVKVSEVLTRE